MSSGLCCPCCGVAADDDAITGAHCASHACATCAGPCEGILRAPVVALRLARQDAPALFVRPEVADPSHPR